MFACYNSRTRTTTPRGFRIASMRDRGAKAGQVELTRRLGSLLPCRPTQTSADPNIDSAMLVSEIMEPIDWHLARRRIGDPSHSYRDTPSPVCAAAALESTGTFASGDKLGWRVCQSVDF